MDLGRRSPSRRWALSMCGAVLGLAAVAFVWAARVPYDIAVLDYGDIASVRVVARDGSPLRTTLGASATRAEWVPLAVVSSRLVQATLAAEDRRFWHHPGVDVLATARAACNDLRARRIVSGGSTITQQLAGMLWPEPRTLGGKLREAVRAVRLEADLEKERILEQYLNRLPYGAGAQGIAAASARYLGRPPQTLSAAQAAALAALPQAPGRYARSGRRGDLLARRNRILAAMARCGWLTRAEAARASALELEFGSEPSVFAAPHFADWVLESRLPALRHAALLETTLDPELQRGVEAIVAAQTEQLRRGGMEQVAVVVQDIATGEVLSLVGSPAWDDPLAGQVNGALALRQPGSALKPFLYAQAFAAGTSPADVLADLPLHVVDGDGGDISPRNYDGRFHGPVRAREALGSSFNVPAIRLQRQLGCERVLEGLRRAGLATLGEPADYYGLGLVLGVGEVTLVDLTNAYAGLARGGVWSEPMLVRVAEDARGLPIAVPAPERSRWLDPAAAFLAADVLADDDARLPGFGVGSVLDLPFPVVVKTGTSTGYRNSWCVGFDAEHAVGVWAGNFDGTPSSGIAAANAAGPVFRQIMLRLHARGSRPWGAAPPPGWSRRRVCALSGGAPGAACATTLLEWFAPGDYEERAACAFHSLRDGRLAVDWPPEYRDWARAQGLDGDGVETALAAVAAARPPRIVSPVDGSVYFLDPRLDNRAGIRLAAQDPDPRARWFLDAAPLAADARPEPSRRAGAIFWRPEAGEHVLVLVGPGGTDRVRFSVR